MASEFNPELNRPQPHYLVHIFKVAKKMNDGKRVAHTKMQAKILQSLVEEVMDVPRKVSKKKKMIRRAIYIAIGLIAISAITFGLARLKPAAPGVERSTVWIDTVKRGDLLRQVRGIGTLVPEEIRWIPTTTLGRVEQIIFRPGVTVKADTVLLVLSNPEAEQAAADVALQLKASEADFQRLKAEIESRRFDQQASVASAEAQQRQDQLVSEKDDIMAKEGLGADLIAKVSKARAEGSAVRLDMERKRLSLAAELEKTQLQAQRAKIEQLQELLRLKRIQLDALRVKAGTDGVLQQISVEVGQQISPGTNMARVADPQKLKAELKIPETQAKDILIGQLAQVDTRNGVVKGHVKRIDPAVQNGTVTVDVAFDEPLPQGARPDLSVDGTVELELLKNIIFVGRPAFGQEKNTITLFKLQKNSNEAFRVQVKLGRSSVNNIELLDGLLPGDQVILSDMSTYDAHDRVRLQ
jgi:HlyD family secretion protein